MSEQIELLINSLPDSALKKTVKQLDKAHTSLQSVYATAILPYGFAGTDGWVFGSVKSSCSTILNLIEQCSTDMNSLLQIMETGAQEISDADKAFKGTLTGNGLYELSYLFNLFIDQPGGVGFGGIFPVFLWTLLNGDFEYSVFEDSIKYEADGFSAEANVNVFNAETKSDVDFSLYETKTKRTYNEKTGKWEDKTETTLVNVSAEVGASVSVLEADGSVEVGDDMLGAEADAEISVGNADVEGKAVFHVTDKGVEMYVKGEAIVSAVEGKTSGTINIFGLEIKLKASGYAGAVGAKGEAGFKDGKFKAEVGAAAGVGGSLGIEIGFNEQGWKDFVDDITFWD